MRKEEKKRYLTLVLLFTLVTSGLLAYYENYKIPTGLRIQADSLRLEYSLDAIPTEMVPMVVKDIPKGARDIGGSIEYVEMPAYIYMKEKKIKLFRNFKFEGKVLKEKKGKGEILLETDVCEVQDVLEDQSRLVELPLTGVVANELRAGQLIDIEVAYKAGGYDVVYAKKRIQELRFPVLGGSNQGQEGYLKEVYAGRPYITIYMTEQEREMYYKAKEQGEFVPRIYGNEKQKASKVTFTGKKGGPQDAKIKSSGDRK